MSSRVTENENLILESARIEIENHGVLGLRVAEVAARAHCSITQIYRRFADRNGLLARVLGDIYEESVENSFKAFQLKMSSLSEITADDIVDNLLRPSQYALLKTQELRLEILAVSVTNEELRTRIKKISQEYVDKWDSCLDHIEERLEKGVKIDRRIFTIMLLIQNMYYRTLLDEKGFTDDEYRQFIKDKILL